MSKIDLDSVIAKINGIALAVIKDELKKGFDDNYYRYLAEESPSVVLWYEGELIKKAVEFKLKEIHEIGCGIGLIPILMGAIGYKGLGIDVMPSRIEVGKRVLKEAAKHFPGIGERVSFICGGAPDVLDNIPKTKAVCVTTNIGAERTEEFKSDFLKAVGKRYNTYIYDACLFWGTHRTKNAIEKVVSSIDAAFSSKSKFLLGIDEYSAYYMIKK